MRTLLHILGIRQDPAQPERPRGGQGQGGGGGRQGGQGGPPPVYRTDVPAHAYDIVMGIVDANSCVINVLCYADRKGTLELSRKGGKVERKLSEQAFAKDVPVAITLDKLKASTPYSYKISFDDGTAAERTFVTQRKPGEKFTFTIQADSHLDGGSAAEVYLRSLETITGSDFLIDLGDTFMPDKYRDYHDSLKQYIAQRYYFDASKVPVRMITGNHDGELGRFRPMLAEESMATWARATRRKYYPTTENNFWSFTWGDALFVALDPFWYSTGRPNQDNWRHTLGAEQHKWLEKTLSESKATYKFVFIHNLVGGLGKDSRGGVEGADGYEWGGKDADGKDIFAEKRPGWSMPIHQLLVRYKVSAVFHGHDHVYAHQSKDGIIYQELPQPSHGRGGAIGSSAEYGYVTGTILPGAGVMRVDIAPDKATFTFLRTDRGKPEKAHAFTIIGKK